MLDIISDEHENERRQIICDEDSRTLPRRQSRTLSDFGVPERMPRPLPWRWTVLIVTALSTLAWIVVLLAVMAVQNSL